MAIHPVKQLGKTLLAANGTNAWLVSALTATECAVPAGWGLVSGATTAGTFNVGTNCSSVWLTASITVSRAAPWAVRVGALVAVPSGGRAGVRALGARG